MRFATLSCAFSLFFTCVCLAQPANKQAFDFNQPQSPPLPVPAGMKYVDQGKFDPRLKGYFSPEGFQVEIVADSPTVINPVGMTFGPDGTLFVLEWRPGANGWPETPEVFTYKDGSKHSIPTMKKEIKDVLKVLTFNPEKGEYDQARIILEDELPSSILIHDGWIYTTGRGTVRRWKLADIIDGKHKDAKPQIVAQGFCGFHHHQVSGMTIGNDGWLYLTSGDNDNYVEGSDGSRATVLRTGAVFRCQPDGSRMEVYSIGFRNPYRDLVYDNACNWFHVDNDNEDGSKFTGCRFMHVAEGADFGWRLFVGAQCCRPDMTRGAVFGELPGKMPAMLKTGRGSPAGLLLYNDLQWPAFYRGWCYYPDVFRKLIRAYKVEPDGSTFRAVNEFEFLKSEDPLFRPCQMITGPDGAAYICDWRTDSGGAGKLWGDNVHGRVYRVRWVGGPIPGGKEESAIALRDFKSWTRLPELSDEELIKCLGDESFTIRVKAQDELRRRGEKNRQALLTILNDKEQPFRARVCALGVLQSFWNEEVRQAFLGLLKEQDFNLRKLAAEGLGLNAMAGDKEVNAALMKHLSDPDLPVRRASALAMGRINAEGAAQDLVRAYRLDRGEDVYLTDGYLRAIERCGKSGIDHLLSLAATGIDSDREVVVSAFLGLRTRAAVEGLGELLNNPHLTDVQSAELVHSYLNYQLDPPVSVEFLFGTKPRNTRQLEATLEVLTGAGQLQGKRAADWLVEVLEKLNGNPEAHLLAIAAVEKARLAEAAPALVKFLGVEGIQADEKLRIVKALRVLNDKSVKPALTAILAGRNVSTALSSEALRSLAAIDQSAAIPFAEKFLDGQDAVLQADAVEVLGARLEGAKRVGERFLEKKLPRELLPKVSEALRKHSSDPVLTKLQAEVLKGGLLLSLTPGEVEKVRELVRSKGNPVLGKAVFLNSKALACVNCHKMEGIGGNVGPDLTRLWDTSTIEKILESILDPSKEIKEGFQTYRALTKGGQTYSGLKVADKPSEVVLREANGKDVRIARDDLESLASSPVSLMPDNAVSQLSFDQFIDLVAFLKDRGAQESLRGAVTDFLVAGPFPKDLQPIEGPEEKPDPTATFPGKLSKEPVRWQPAAAEPNGLLNLQAIFGKERLSAYAFTFIYSPKDQKCEMRIGTEGTSRLWVNGKLVHEQGTARSAQPDNDRIMVEFRQGWNPVVVKVVNRPEGHGLYLRVVGEGVRSSAKKE